MMERYRDWTAKSARLLAFLTVIDIPIVLLVFRFTGKPIPQIVVNILVIEGSMFLLIYTFMISRRLNVRYKLENMVKKGDSPKGVQQIEYSIHWKPQVLLCAILLILIGFLLNFITYTID